MKKLCQLLVCAAFLLPSSGVHVLAQSTITTFSYTGGAQTYIVPPGVTFLKVTVKGAEGGTGIGTGGGAAGGEGSVVTATLNVVQGTTLNIFVGGAGTAFSAGFNGGGNNSSGGGAGGGGASDIRIGGTTTTNRVVIAAGGGGGGGGSLTAYPGGKGGALTGEDGSPASTLGGKGGTQIIGGQGGSAALCGGAGLAGNAGIFATGANGTGSSGGGGGGFYGGGSGGNNSGGTCNNGAGGGGGGSSNISTSVATLITMTQGGNTGNGSVTIEAPNAPSTTTISANTITANSATLVGLIADNGAVTTTSFDYSNIQGLSSNIINVSATPASIPVGGGSTSVTTTITGLSANTTYYYRARGTNSVSSTTGAILSFTTLNNAPVFVSGDNQTIAVCRNSASYSFTSQLHVMDQDPFQTLTWSVAKAPNHNGVIGGLSPVTTAISGNINIPPGSTVSYTPATGFSGTEIFSIQVSDGKASDTTTFTVTVNPLPTPSITATNGVQLSVGSYASYQWYKNNIALVGSTLSTYTIIDLGDYYVSVTDNNGCTGISNIYKYPPLAVKEIQNITENIHLYPNPAGPVLHITAPVAVNATITTPDGRVVLHATDANNMDISALVAGMYIVHIHDKDGTLLKVEKLIRTSQ